MQKSILKFCLFLLIGFLFTFSGFSQENSLLWKISGNGLKEDSYLFGTIHLICKEDFSVSDQVKSALLSSDQVILELDMDDPTLMSEMQKFSIREGMKNLKEAISPEEAQILNEFFTENYGAGLDQIGILKPFVLSSMALIKSLSCEQTESYEQFFKNHATESGKEILGLESVESQIGIFDQIPESIQISELVKMIQENSGNEEFAELVALYLDQDLNQMYQLMTEDGMFAEYQDILLDKRNENWIPVLESQLMGKSSFVAVGGGHLAGEKGVVNLLRAKGYVLTPLR